MSAEAVCERIDNAAHGGAQPLLSVLIPFKGDDPSDLIAALDGAELPVEIIVLDDGGGDEALTRRVAAAIGSLAAPGRLVRLSANRGRAAARNQLAREARGRHLLFLDADMAPGDAQFLGRWLDIARRQDPAVAFGGFVVPPGPCPKPLALHRAMALHSDCAGVRVRERAPEKHVFTSNLLVRAGVFETVAFDAGFSGWGWEDVEWAVRAAGRYAIVHVDNPAIHLGLDPAPVLVSKYEQSSANFARFAAAHPRIVADYPCHRAARILRRVPGRARLAALFRGCALAAGAPLGARALALRLYRAALYAEAV